MNTSLACKSQRMGLCNLHGSNASSSVSKFYLILDKKGEGGTEREIKRKERKKRHVEVKEEQRGRNREREKWLSLELTCVPCFQCMYYVAQHNVIHPVSIAYLLWLKYFMFH